MNSRTLHLRIILPILALAGGAWALAQGLPTSQPNLIHIWRESVKPGRAADHAAHEAGYPAAFAKAGSPDHYLALTSVTGPSEAWYVTPFKSHAAIGESFKLEAKDPTLAAELARLARVDAEFINGVEIIQAMARPDLSIGTYPDIAKARFFEITVYRLRPGQVSQFEAAAKAWGAAVKRAAPAMGARVYQVIAGMPSPTFLVFSSVEDYAEFDRVDANVEAAWKASTPEEQETIRKFAAEAVLEEVSNKFRLDPVQSYVPKETRDKDPGFWQPK